MYDVLVDNRQERVCIYPKIYLKEWENTGKTEAKEYKKNENLLKFADLIKMPFVRQESLFIEHLQKDF